MALNAALLLTALPLVEEGGEKGLEEDQSSDGWQAKRKKIKARGGAEGEWSTSALPVQVREARAGEGESRRALHSGLGEGGVSPPETSLSTGTACSISNQKKENGT